MAKMTPQEIAAKYAKRAKAAIPETKAGILRVTESPMEKAAAQQEKYLAGVVQAAEDGKWQAGLRRVTLQDWKTKTAEVGTQRIAAGVDAAINKLVAFYTELLPFQEALQAQIDQMADITLEDSIARSTAWIRGMAAFERRG